MKVVPLDFCMVLCVCVCSFYFYHFWLGFVFGGWSFALFLNFSKASGFLFECCPTVVLCESECPIPSCVLSGVKRFV